jgi:hypothetical protein
MGENPWWHPSERDPVQDEPLPDLIELAPDYSADLPLWGCDGSGNIAWQNTKFLSSCWTGSPRGRRSSMPTSTGRPAGDPLRYATAGPGKPWNWPQMCAQS